MIMLRREIAAAARTSATVLIVGETGVGKDLVARLIHDQSARRSRSFVVVIASGVPETLLESEMFGHARGSFTGAFNDQAGYVRLAHGGTLFLDEVGEMSLRMQAVLLRFAETGEIQTVGARGIASRADVRLITATNRDLSQQIALGAFRADLYYRLNVIPIHVPPLRQRTDDILPLLNHFLREQSIRHGLPRPTVLPAAERLLQAHEWPGNVRELKNVAERLVVTNTGRAVDPNDLPSDIREGGHPAAALPGPASMLATGSSQPQSSSTLPGQLSVVENQWQRIMGGCSFREVVEEPFKARAITRSDVRALVERGLQETRGNFRALLTLFHLPASDYKRFLRFLSHHDCKPQFRSYRIVPFRQAAGQ
jgi:DNA-binding NtrC family response regulator